MINECRNELTNNIMPFWESLIDKDRGGFYGYMDTDLNLDKDADKGVILNSRILWFFANCNLILADANSLEYARHAYEFLKKHCVDREHGGVYWMLDKDGNVADDMKHTYNQAFAIYALSSYYDASKDEEAIELAMDLFNTIESKTLDEYGYREAFDRYWVEVENEALAENGIMPKKSMNTILHLIEAYTELLRVKHDSRVKERLRALLQSVIDKVYDEENKQLRVFFDEKLSVIGDIHSYGHDIEAAWLIDRACDVLGDKAMSDKMERMGLEIARKIHDIAIENGALNNERVGNHIDKERIWWVQAEGVVGFINAYERSGKVEYLDTAKSIWEYIKGNVIDEREGGEWHSQVSFDGVPTKEKPVVEAWKCPYHNGRMCLEVISRGVEA